MKYQLFSYRSTAGAVIPGIKVGELHYPLPTLLERVAPPYARSVCASVDDIVENWQFSRNLLSQVVIHLSQHASDFVDILLDESSVNFLTPLTRPNTIYGAGANYRDHVAAMAKAFNMNLSLDPKGDGIPPWHFVKAGRSTLAGHRVDVKFPGETKQLDWEAELAVVIGTGGRFISVEEALNHVAGYTCANDLSARDMLRREQVDPSSPFRFDWIGHKSFNGSSPLGPYFTPAEFVQDPEDLDIKLWVNGEIKQDSNTKNHMYNISEQISYLSGWLDLHPGDIILTGTPAGVGMESLTFLSRGDVIDIEIEGLGRLTNRVV